MTNFIPVFPLNIVVYPGEVLNLHIFEPRYKQLIHEKIHDKKPFGIPAVLGKKTAEFGMLMEITEIAKIYDNGEMDIRTMGTKVFRILEFIQDIPEKLYSGAIVSYPENILEPQQTEIARLIVEEVKKRYALIGMEEKYAIPQNKPLSYSIAHYIGLSMEQEYELLGILNETQRLEYIRRHMNSILPVVNELEAVKSRIQMNGHFRDLKLEE